MTRTLIHLSLFSLLFIACKDESKKDVQSNVETTKELIQTLENPSQNSSQLPRLYSNGVALYFSWVSKRDSLDVLNYSVMSDKGWQESTEIITGHDWFTNWADFPAIAENNGNILTNFLQKSATGTYTYDIKLNLYSPSAESSENQWKKSFILHKDGTESEHGFVSMLPYEEDSFFVTWLDGRDTVGKGHGGGQMTLRAALIDREGNISMDAQLDSRICDCCQTSAAMTPNGPIVVYRDRGDTEIRDISIVRWDNNQWTTPQSVGDDLWEINGCPVNGPSVDAIGNNLAVTWFTAAQGIAQVKVAFSEDGGRTFGIPLRMDNGDAIGRVDVIMLDETSAVLSWMEPQGDDTLIQLQRITSQGLKGELVTLAKTSASRSSGFPQIEKLNGKIYAAWTIQDGDIGSIEMATIDISDL